MSNYGQYIKALRMEQGVTLYELSKVISKTPAYLSAIENNKKPASDQLAMEIAAFFNLDEVNRQRIRKLADRSRSELRVDLVDASIEKKEFAASFGRKFDSLDQQQLEEIRKILEKKKNN